MIEYEQKSKIELIALCKEKAIKGYSNNSKEYVIQLLKNELEHKLLIKRNNLHDYLTINNPSILTKYAGSPNDLKIISHSTMAHYTWKCANYSDCANTFLARPRDVYRNDSKSPTQHCSLCRNKDSGLIRKRNMLEKNGSIQSKMPEIAHVWCEDNKLKPNEVTDYSHERVKLKCPNKSAKHPDYEILVYNIQKSNCYSCSKCSVKTSKAEMRIYSELKFTFKDVKWQQKIEDREADVTIEDLKLVIEIDGFPWHKDKSEKDLAKNKIFEKNGYTVLRIRDTKLGKLSCDTIVCDVSELSIADYNKIIEWIKIKFKYDIQTIDAWKNTDHYREIQASVLTIPYDTSVEHLYPESIVLWDYQKNHPFIPSSFTPGSHMEVWIKCKSGHSYKRPVHNIFRTTKNKKRHVLNCPECIKPKSNKRIIQINNITYKSIAECCRRKNIVKNRLYIKMEEKGIDYSIIDEVQKFIEVHLDSLTKK